MTAVLSRAGMLLGLIVLAFAGLLGTPTLDAAMAQEGTPNWIIELKDGTVDIELLPAVAPRHVARIIELTNAGFYNGIVWHRVIEGFMAQSGDPTGTGTGGSDLPDVPAEFNAQSFTRGAVGAARTSDPNSFNSQFFICFEDCTFLDGQYTVFGRVVSGMEFIDAIRKGDPQSGLVENPDRIVSATIEYR